MAHFAEFAEVMKALSEHRGQLTELRDRVLERSQALDQSKIDLLKKELAKAKRDADLLPDALAALLVWSSFPHASVQTCDHQECLEHNAAAVRMTQDVLRKVGLEEP